MKQHTQKFKDEIKELGRQQKVVVSFYDNSTRVQLNNEFINSVKLFYKGSLLKSVMKGLDLDINIAIPIGTEINLQYGILVDGEYEYLDYGNYIVKDIEKQEDSSSYLLKCYDKLIFSMKDYESLGLTYPVTIDNFMNALCNKIGLEFKNYGTTYVNSNKEIPSELYIGADGNSIGYTYRDALDEIAQVTGGIICLDTNDKVEIRYINETNDTIDEEYLKDINVNFGKKIVINSLVLSRAGESDNIYRQDDASIQTNGLYEIKIVNNQIMNFNNRDEYIDAIFNKINGTTFYLNDYTSTGIVYYDIADKYNVKIGENTYPCIMLNDEIKIEQGLEEHIYIEEQENSKTDYTKADKTDRRINQTYIIVDKQNQKIESVVSQIGDRSDKTTTITQELDGLHTLVQDIEDLTLSVEGTKTILLENCMQGYLYEFHVYGNNEIQQSLFPRPDLYPSPTLYPTRFDETLFGNQTISGGNTLFGYRSNFYDSRLEVIDKDGNSKTYDLGIIEVLRQSGDVCDEYILKEGKAKIIRRINADGTIKATPIEEDLGELYIDISEGNNTIKMYNSAKIKAIYVTKTQFSDVFAPSVNMNAQFDIQSQEIKGKVAKNEIATEIALNYKAVQIAWNLINQYIQFITEGENAELQILDSPNNKLMSLNKNGQQFFRNNKVFGKMGVHTDSNGDNYIAFSVPIGQYNSSIQDGMAWGVTTPSGNFYPIFKMKNFSIGAPNTGQVFGELELVASDLIIGSLGNGIVAGFIRIEGEPDGLDFFSTETDMLLLQITAGLDGNPTIRFLDGVISAFVNLDNGYTFQVGENPDANCRLLDDGIIICNDVIKRSREEYKKNIEKLENGLDIVRNTDIYKYNFKNEKDAHKKHIGAIISDKYNYSHDITAEDSKNKEIGIDDYSMTAVSFKAIQELDKIIKKQQEEIDFLKEEIKKLKGE